MRNGRSAAVPWANTVSVCAISRIRPLPVPVSVATMLSPTAGLAGTISMVGAELAQLLDGDGADLHEAVRIAGAGIDVDQPLQQLDRAGLVMLGAIEDWLVRLGAMPEPPPAPALHEHESAPHRPPPSPARPFARSGNAFANPSRVAGSTPRSVISPVTSRAGVTSKP